MSTQSPPQPGIDAFHRERSKCIDAFAQLESALIWLLGQAGHSNAAEHFSQKITHLKKVKPNSKLSKSQLSRVHELLGRCEAMAEVRNDIVHSTLQLAVIAESNRACFVNNRYCQSDSQTARLFTLGSLRALSAEMSQLADDLRNSRPA